MWPIIYRILIPGVLLLVVFFWLSICRIKDYKKRKQKTKGRDKYTKDKAYIIIFIALSIIGFSSAVYNSFDLIKKDFVVVQGTYDTCYRGRELYTREMRFIVNDKKIAIYGFRNDEDMFEVGKEYTITYAKRTLMLLSAEEMVLGVTQGSVQNH